MHALYTLIYNLSDMVLIDRYLIRSFPVQYLPSSAILPGAVAINQNSFWIIMGAYALVVIIMGASISNNKYCLLNDYFSSQHTLQILFPTFSSLHNINKTK